MATARRDPSLLDAWSGRPLNCAAIAREIGVSGPTARAWVRSLEREGAAQVLPHLGGHRRPLLYTAGSLEGMCVSLIVTRMAEALPGCRFAWWMTGRVRRIDLVAETPEERIGFRIVPDRPLARRDWLPLWIAYRRQVIGRGFLLFPWGHAFVTARVVLGLPLHAFLEDIEAWMLGRRTPQEWQPALGPINERYWESLGFR